MEVWRPEYLGLNCKFSTMFWGCITYQGTFTEVEDNINSRKYINMEEIVFGKTLFTSLLPPNFVVFHFQGPGWLNEVDSWIT
jgi:hypothetical protein